MRMLADDPTYIAKRMKELGLEGDAPAAAPTAPATPAPDPTFGGEHYAEGDWIDRLFESGIGIPYY